MLGAKDTDSWKRFLGRLPEALQGLESNTQGLKPS
jgi:hypothetical protein